MRDVEEKSMTIKVTLKPGHRMNYHSHERRREIWTVVSGEGRAIIDGELRQIRPGNVIHMPIGCRHSVIADTELKIIEEQLGQDINANDKIKYVFPSIEE